MQIVVASLTQEVVVDKTTIPHCQSSETRVSFVILNCEGTVHDARPSGSIFCLIASG